MSYIESFHKEFGWLKNKKVVMAFSGGYDSTVITMILAKLGCDITLLEVEGPTLLRHVEKKAAAAIKEEFAQQGIKFERAKFVMADFPALGGGYIGTYVQMNWWFTIFQMVRTNGFDHFIVGNVAGDPEVGFFDDLKAIEESFSKLARRDVAAPTYEMPFRKWEKIELLGLLCELYDGHVVDKIIGLTVSCSRPQTIVGDYFVGCGECPSCHGNASSFNHRHVLLKKPEQVFIRYPSVDEFLKLLTDISKLGFYKTSSGIRWTYSIGDVWYDLTTNVISSPWDLKHPALVRHKRNPVKPLELIPYDTNDTKKEI